MYPDSRSHSLGFGFYRLGSRHLYEVGPVVRARYLTAIRHEMIKSHLERRPAN